MDIYCKTQRLPAILYNNYKWRITFKNCESLCCTPETYIILYINYTSRKEERKRKKKEICEFENRKSMKQLNKKLAIWKDKVTDKSLARLTKIKRENMPILIPEMK